MSYEDENKNPYKWTIVPQVRHKVFKVRIVREYYRSDKNVKYKLLRDESHWDEVSGFPVAKSSIDSRKYPIFQTAILFIVFYCIDPSVGNIYRRPPARARRTTFWPVAVNPKPNLSDLYGMSGSFNLVS